MNHKIPQGEIPVSSKIVRHGEGVFMPVDSVPATAKLVGEFTEHIACHSESGHHHTLLSEKPFKVYEEGDFVYFELIDTSTLVHEKTGDHVHAPVKFVPGVRRLHKKEQYNPIQKAYQKIRD